MMPLLPELESEFGLGSTTMSSLTGLKSRLDGVSPYRGGWRPVVCHRRHGLNSYEFCLTPDPVNRR
jgi:hypothetical protein